jgi:hypothetical protein
VTNARWRSSSSNVLCRLVHVVSVRSLTPSLQLGAGISWSKIGETLDTSAQAAQQRYGEVVEQV